MRIALAQIDSAIGAVESNFEMLRDLIAQANGHKADLTVFPELAVHGYWLGQLPENRSPSTSTTASRSPSETSMPWGAN